MKLCSLIICTIVAMSVIPTADHIGPSRGYDGWGYYENSDISKPMLPETIYFGNRDYDENGKLILQNPVNEALFGIEYFSLLGIKPNNVYLSYGQNVQQINGYSVFNDWKNTKVMVYKGNDCVKRIGYFNFIGNINIYDHYIFISKYTRSDRDSYDHHDYLFFVDLEGDKTGELRMPDTDKKQYNDPGKIKNLPDACKNGIAIVSNMAIELDSMKHLWTLNPSEQFLGFDGNSVISLNYYEKFEEGKQREEMRHYEIVKRGILDGIELGRYELKDKTMSSVAAFVNGTLVGQEETYEKVNSFIKIKYVLFLARYGGQKPYFTLESEYWPMDLRLSVDRKHLFVGYQNRQLCIELKTGKIIFSIPIPNIISFQRFAGQMYMNWESTDANGTNYENLSLLGSFSPIVKKPKAYFKASNDFAAMVTLVPTKYGILWVPQNQSQDKPQLLSRTGKKLKEFSVPGWGADCWPSMAVDQYKLYIDCTGKSLAIVSLATGQAQTIDFTDKTYDRYLIVPRPILVNDHFCVVLDSTGVTHIIDLDQKKIISSLTDQHNFFNTNIEIRDNLYFDNFQYNADMNKKLPQVDYKLPRYLGMLKDSYFTKHDSDYDPNTNVTSKCLGEVSLKDNTKETYTVPEDISQFFYNNLTDFQIVTDNSAAKCQNHVVDMEKRTTLYPTLANHNQRKMQVSMTTQDGFVEVIDNSICQYKPCPTFSLKKTGNLSFELEVTSSGGDIPMLEGKARLVVMGDMANTREVVFDPDSDLKIQKTSSKEKVSLEFKPTEKFLDALKNGANRFGLLIESNGLLDTSKSELSDGDTEERALYDGIPLKSDTPKSMVLTYWRM